MKTQTFSTKGGQVVFPNYTLLWLRFYVLNLLFQIVFQGEEAQDVGGVKKVCRSRYRFCNSAVSVVCVFSRWCFLEKKQWMMAELERSVML